MINDCCDTSCLEVDSTPKPALCVGEAGGEGLALARDRHAHPLGVVCMTSATCFNVSSGPYFDNRYW